MGGAFKILEAKTKKDLREKVRKFIRRSKEIQLSDVRKKEFWKDKGIWKARVWVHS